MDSIVVPTLHKVPFVQVSALNDLYLAANGSNWLWRDIGNHSTGAIWNFTTDSKGNYVLDPCMDGWQGICCTHLSLKSPKRCEHLGSDHGTGNNSVTVLQLPMYDLDGTLPSSLCDLQDLRLVSLQANRLHGSIPTGIGKFGHIISIYLQDNAMSGTIPHSISMLSTLQNFDIYHNLFEGSIPESLGLLSELVNVNLQVNYFTNTIPSTLGFLANLYDLNLGANLLTGTFPANLLNLKNISALELSSNSLTGALPSAFGQLSTLQSFAIYNNYITGLIPTSIGLLSDLSVCYMNYNFVTGQLPSQLGLITNLYGGLFMQNNLLTGPIPTSLGLMAGVSSIVLQSNMLTGELPREFSLLQKLEILLLHENQLSGSPGQSFTSNQVLLSTVDLSDNNFSGSVPYQLFHLPNISTIALIKNCFSGSLPLDICMLNSSVIRTLALDGLTTGSHCEKPLVFGSFTTNQFIEGSVPSCLYTISSLKVLQLSGNGLTGSLPGNADLQISSSLRNLSLCHNRLSGSIPLLFQQHHFNFLDLSYNRINGNLNSMGSFFTSADPTVIADFPDPTNKSLHLTPRVELHLEVNRLSGFLPSTFYDAEFIEIVSGNLFGCRIMSGLPRNDQGTKTTQCGSNSLNVSLYATGAFVVILLLWLLMSHRTIMRLMKGNSQKLRECSNSKAHQASHSLDMGRSVWHKLAINANFLWDCWHISSMIIGNDLDDKDCDHDEYDNSRSGLSSMPSARLVTRNFLLQIAQLRRIVQVLALPCIACLLPLQMILKLVSHNSFSTHSFQYAYTPSVGFLSGPVPASCVLITGCLYLAFVSYCIHTITKTGTSISSDDEGIDQQQQQQQEQQQKPDLHKSQHEMEHSSSQTATACYCALSHLKTLDRLFVVYVVFPLCDMIIIVAANAFYLYVALNSSPVNAFLAQIGLVLLKIGCNSVILPIAVRWLRAIYYPGPVVTALREKGDGTGDHGDFGALLPALIIFNNILAPLITTVCTDPNCFYNVFVEPNEVNVGFSYMDCGAQISTSQCISLPKAIYLSYAPPFIYSYQCSSYVLINYVPVFVLMYLYLALVSPLLYTGIVCLMSVDNTSRVCSGRFARQLFSCVPRVLHDPRDNSGARHHFAEDENDESHEASGCAYALHDGENLVTGPDISTTSPSTANLLLFNSETIVSNFICHLAVLVTFGSAYPILALLVAVTVAVENVQWRLLIGRYLLLHSWRRTGGSSVWQSMRELSEQLRESSLMVGDKCAGSHHMLLSVIALFLSFFLLDMTGGKEGREGVMTMLWAPLCVLLWTTAVLLAGRSLMKKMTMPMTDASTAAIATPQQSCLTCSLTTDDTHSHSQRHRQTSSSVSLPEKQRQSSVLEMSSHLT